MSEQLSGNSGQVRCPEWVGGYGDSSPCQLPAGHYGEHKAIQEPLYLLGSFKVNPQYLRGEEQ